MGPSEGPAIVLIHGYIEERRVWTLVAERLVESGHRVIAYDQRGHGRSTIGTSDVNVERLGADLAQLLHTLQLDDVVIAGHSMGGMATQAMLINHPDAASRVRGVVLVSTAASGVGLPPFAHALGEVVTGLGGGDAFLERSGLGTAVVRAAFGKGASTAHVHALRDMLLATSPASRRTFLRLLHTMDLRPGLASIDVPTSIIVGTRDTLTPTNLSRELAESIPGSTLDVLPALGHMLPFEAPDEVTHLIELAAKTAA
jgi:pimeloyl-ACP methyl ester carboxylesterase